jgi:pseudouridine synthase
VEAIPIPTDQLENEKDLSPTESDPTSLVTSAPSLSLDSPLKSQSRVRLIVSEGKHRMVRRMLHNAGHSVLDLKRIRYGQIRLGGLPVGGCRFLNRVERIWAEQIAR